MEEPVQIPREPQPTIIDDPMRHAPSPDVAQPVGEMFSAAHVAQRLEDRLGPFPFDQYPPRPEFHGLPVLGPYRHSVKSDGEPCRCTYKGQYREGKREGRGREVDENGNAYEGYWEGDK